jgi:hypothetical protein
MKIWLSTQKKEVGCYEILALQAPIWVATTSRIRDSTHTTPSSLLILDYTSRFPGWNPGGRKFGRDPRDQGKRENEKSIEIIRSEAQTDPMPTVAWPCSGRGPLPPPLVLSISPRVPSGGDRCRARRQRPFEPGGHYPRGRWLGQAFCDSSGRASPCMGRLSVALSSLSRHQLPGAVRR